jgi:5-methylcytosine-specific restriction endonuclease McrA
VSRPWGGRKVAQLRAQVLAAYGDVCHLCGGRGATSPDHVIPRSQGGTDALHNLRPAHERCNESRGDTPLHEWFARHPRSAHLTPSRDW